jgi:hypothetical protein
MLLPRAGECFFITIGIVYRDKTNRILHVVLLFLYGWNGQETRKLCLETEGSSNILIENILV